MMVCGTERLRLNDGRLVTRPRLRIDYIGEKSRESLREQTLDGEKVLQELTIPDEPSSVPLTRRDRGLLDHRIGMRGGGDRPGLFADDQQAQVSMGDLSEDGLNRWNGGLPDVVGYIEDGEEGM